MSKKTFHQKITDKELLKIPGIRKEIQKHVWIESEKAGYDIGFDRAAEEWLRHYSRAWLDYHGFPAQKTKISKKYKRVK